MISSLPPALFVADAPALDFINSRAMPTGEIVDWLRGGEDFLAWLDQAKLAPPEVIAKLRAEARPAEIDAVARKARVAARLVSWLCHRAYGPPADVEGGGGTRTSQPNPCRRLAVSPDRPCSTAQRVGAATRASRYLGKSNGAGTTPSPCCSRSLKRWANLFARRIFPASNLARDRIARSSFSIIRVAVRAVGAAWRSAAIAQSKQLHRARASDG